MVLLHRQLIPLLRLSTRYLFLTADLPKPFVESHRRLWNHHRTPKMHLLLDWDETLTTHDTLAQIAPPDGTHPGPSFAHYSEAYMSDYDSHVKSYKPDVKSIASVGEQFAFLASLRDVELQSNRRIEEGGLFVGWEPSAAEQRAREQVELRPGVKDSLQAFIRNDHVHTSVISVSWSSAFIRAGLNTTKDGFRLNQLRSNTIELDEGTNRGTGKMSKSGQRGVRTGLDKVREMYEILREDGGGGDVVVYAGDSNTDLPCLLAASLGVIVGDNTSLSNTLKRLGLADRVFDGYDAFASWLEREENGRRILPVPTRTEGGSLEAFTSRAANKPHAGVLLVRVKDWHEGTRVLEGVLRATNARKS